MVLKRRLDYGLNGYEFPSIPRAARSVRRRVPFKKRFQENQMSAFDLLADVAGKLLLENDTSTPSGNVVPKDETFEAKACDRASPDRSHCHKGSLYSDSGVFLGLASAATNSGFKENGDKLVNGEVTDEIGITSTKVSDTEHSIKDEPCKPEKEVANDIGAGMFTSEVPLVSDDKKRHKLNSIDSTLLCAQHIPHCSYPANEDNNVNIVSRDDDENSSGCTHPITKRFLRPTPRIGDRRIRKIMASRCWKVASRRKDTTFSNRRDVKPFYQNGKNYHRFDRSEGLYPIKKRRRFGYSSLSNYGGVIDSEFASEFPHNGYNADASGAMKRKSYQPRDRHVKLRIKSFKVPELFVEISESATVGSLKVTMIPT